jgi:hypothetical protein
MADIIIPLLLLSLIGICIYGIIDIERQIRKIK